MVEALVIEDDYGYPFGFVSLFRYFLFDWLRSIHFCPLNYAGLKLRDYQLFGVNWFYNRYDASLGAILCDEMGLGKTCQVRIKKMTCDFYFDLYNLDVFHRRSASFWLEASRQKRTRNHCTWLCVLCQSSTIGSTNLRGWSNRLFCWNSKFYLA